ncbi:Anaphase-promoting complex subunit 23 [Boothiomyces sp. JEL0866]|nr:Anaphase-promoting complex subunit 23 [Boothiomyces sp. JEL0866]
MELVNAATECSIRGLNQSTKWLMEQIVARGIDSVPVNQSYSSKYLFAKSMFDTREYLRCWHLLRNEDDLVSKFLRNYSYFLAIQFNNQKEDDLIPNTNNQQYHDLIVELKEIYLQDPFLMYLYAIVLLDTGDSNGKNILLDSLKLYPYNWSAWEALEKYDPILEQFSNSIPLEMFLLKTGKNEIPNSDNPYIQLQQALYYYNTRDYDQAEKIFKIISQRDPYFIDSMDCYSNILFVLKNSAELYDLAYRMSLTNRFTPETMVCIGNYYSMHQNREKAIEYFSRALKLDTRYGPAWILLGHEYVESCLPKQALECYRKALEIDESDFRAWYGLAQAYDLLQVPTFSIYYYQKALVLRPNDTRIWSALSQSLEQLGKYDEAIACLKRLMTTEHDPVEYIKLAKLYLKINPELEKNIAFYYQKYIKYGDDFLLKNEAHEYLSEYWKKRGNLERYKQHQESIKM